MIVLNLMLKVGLQILQHLLYSYNYLMITQILQSKRKLYFYFKKKMLLHQIALTIIPDIGDINGKKLIAYCGGAEAVFSEKKKNLLKIPGIGNKLAASILSQDVLKRAEEEIKFIEQHKIKPLFFLDDDYPSRLKHCNDNPMMLYFLGNADLNYHRIISVVGTRKSSDYGREVCEKLINDFAAYNPMIVSGLAYGIDSIAHKSSINAALPTVGILAHGLDILYPDVNKSLAKKMLENGGLLTEFMSKTKMDPSFFPRRNRIIAGICDAVVVIETNLKGGSMITAHIANSYNRDVLAVPGRVNDPNSAGCNYLIRANIAALLRSAEDLAFELGWDLKEKTQPNPQKKLFIKLSAEEEKILNILNIIREAGIDWLCIESELPMSKVAAALLNLEFEGLVKSLPGKQFKLL